MRSFEDSLNAHKSELTEALIVFGEHKRVGKALAELETQRPEFYKFYKDGQESRQNEVDELQKRLDDLTQVVEELLEEMKYPTATFEEVICSGVRELEQALKGGLTPDLNTDENGECRHFSTAMFNDGKAECFHCDAIVNGKREVIGKQSKGLHPFFKKAQKN